MLLDMKNAVKKVENKQPLGATAYGEIYRKIISLKYKPGQRLEEKQLVEDLAIGRTPIREALLRLAGDLMVQSHPNKGFVVRPITLQDTKAVFEALRILELGVAELAVRQDLDACLSSMATANEAVKSAIAQMDVLGLVEANHDFHMHFARCSSNRYLIRGLHEARCETNRLAFLSYGNEIDPRKSLHDHYESVIQQHEAVMHLLRERDETGLKETLHEHMQDFQQRIVLYLTS
jgi:DNA-binding GntR family transcriptional regulator